ncbi:sulfite exporter TauE/SafE family protein [Boudabousia marimammalium]|uniref:Probable membrane transporter protein n=1 Tax=Boudabousia marimammalium TaxID=156892 RepID=A0A1Q5PJ60_9ACTO|nr:sulfite exporter TauE/SafE family protein [Boudabousia marimammalium]OKL45897.1 hypothetical protein BM477_07780 [Boudabousia marimammalium]
MNYVISILVGVGVGVVVSALGAGGGILSVPVLTYFLGQSPHDATSASLVIVAITALIPLRKKYQAGQVLVKEGLIFGALTTLGAILGRTLNAQLDGRQLVYLFALLLFVVALIMLRRARRMRLNEGAKSGPQTPTAGERAALSSKMLALLAVMATGTGMLTGLFGVGGGFAVVPIFMLVLKFDIRRATGTSLIVMFLASLTSIGTGLAQGTFHADWLLVALFVAGSFLGSKMGGRLSQSARPSSLTGAFSGLLFFASVYMFVRTWFGF